jgi:hypothetical protein
MFEHVEKITTAGLRKICRENKLSGYGKLRKADLVIFVKKHLLEESIKKGIDELLQVE